MHLFYGEILFKMLLVFVFFFCFFVYLVKKVSPLNQSQELNKHSIITAMKKQEGIYKKKTLNVLVKVNT